MNPWWVVLVAAVVFGCVGFLSVQLSAMVCKGIVPFEDGPKPGRPPVTMLVVGTAVVGMSLALRGVAIPSLAVVAVLMVALVACWYSDVLCGIVPDYFTLIPLGVWLLLSLIEHNYAPFVAAAVVFVTFSIFALLSKGRGMGWGDVKLATLGAAVLGPPAALLAFSGACLVAVFVAAIRRRRTEPIAFAPYLSGAIAAALAFPLFPA